MHSAVVPGQGVNCIVPGPIPPGYPQRANCHSGNKFGIAFEDVLAATVAVVTHHFRRTLLAVAQEHIERVGSDDERQAVASWSE